MRYRPSLVVATVNDAAVAPLVAVIVTPGSTALDVSVTRPSSVPLMTWAPVLPGPPKWPGARPERGPRGGTTKTKGGGGTPQTPPPPPPVLGAQFYHNRGKRARGGGGGGGGGGGWGGRLGRLGLG